MKFAEVKVLGIIPARYHSSRFPGKVLAMLKSKPMVQWVYEGASECIELNKLIVATDSEEVKDKVEQFGAEAIMTNSAHISGTDRCCEAYERLQEEYDIVVNIQCDLPLIKSDYITALIDSFEEDKTDIATLASPLKEIKHLINPNTVKVILSTNNDALYFSRAPLPYFRDMNIEEWLKNHEYYEHIGLYAYRTKVLTEIVQLHPTKIEQVEKLEQLRWLENGYKIKVGKCNKSTIGVDTPEDLEYVEKLLDEMEKKSIV